MLDRVRLGLSVLSVALLGGLYAASQLAVLQGRDQAMAYSHWIDQPWMQVLAALILLSALVLAFVGRKDGSANS